jgi:hypothetical protein
MENIYESLRHLRNVERAACLDGRFAYADLLHHLACIEASIIYTTA